MIETLHPQEHRSETMTMLAPAQAGMFDNALSALTVKPKLPLLTTDFSSTKSTDDINDQLSIAPTPTLSSERNSLAGSPGQDTPSNPPEFSSNLTELHQGVDALLLLAACASTVPAKKPRKSNTGANSSKKRAHEGMSSSTSAHLSDADTDAAAHSTSPTPPPANKRAKPAKDGMNVDAPANPDSPQGLDELSTAAASITDGSASAASRGSYKCGRCGQPKKGHVCAIPAPLGEEEEGGKMAVKGRPVSKGKSKAMLPASKMEAPVCELGGARSTQDEGSEGASPRRMAAAAAGVKACAVPSNMVCALFLAGCASAPIPHRPGAPAQTC